VCCCKQVLTQIESSIFWLLPPPALAGRPPFPPQNPGLSFQRAAVLPSPRPTFPRAHPQSSPGDELASPQAGALQNPPASGLPTDPPSDDALYSRAEPSQPAFQAPSASHSLLSDQAYPTAAELLNSLARLPKVTPTPSSEVDVLAINTARGIVMSTENAHLITDKNFLQ
jgi:hypothetical protein